MFEGQKRGGGGDVVLESRHLVGLFLLFVVISGLFFPLGWVMRGSQQDALLAAAYADSKKEAARANLPSGAAGQPSGAPCRAVEPKPLSDLDFYRAAESKKAEPRLEKPAKAEPAGPKSASARLPVAVPVVTRNASAKPKALLNAPLIPRGAIVLQVAAVKNEQDALALAEALQTKKFPAFVLMPGEDSYYRVQVGPYADQQSANQARRGLEQQGFKAIVKR